MLNLYEGIINACNIIDDIILDPYISQNYSPILNYESRWIILLLARDKISVAFELPHCVHALGAVRKASGKLQPKTDCHRPIGLAINKYMDATCSTFSCTHVD